MNKKGKEKKRISVRKKLLYYFDVWLSKGTISTVVFLVLITGILVVLIGLLSTLFGGQGDSLGKSLWDTMNHAFDPGVLSGDSGSHVFLFLMLIATLIGVFFLAILIGIVNDGIQGRVADLAKGIEAVVEKDHVIILGFNESTYLILGELIEAYRNQKGKRNVVVIMDQIDKMEMEDRIRIEFPDTGNLRIICRSGSISNIKDLNRCSIQTCKSIVIAEHEDFKTIKCILACTKILNEEPDSKAYMTSVIYGRESEYAARIAGSDYSEDRDLFSVKNDRLELLMMENTISKIMTHTCRQNGLSQVFTELFNFSGHEFYIARLEKNEKLYALSVGKSIRQINSSLTDAIAVGIIQENGTALIGDPNTVILKEGCQLILLQEDDDVVTPIEEQLPDYIPPVAVYKSEPSSILIVGCNEKLPYILREMCEYLTPGTMVYLSSSSEELKDWIDDEIIEEMLGKDIDSAVCIQNNDTLKEDSGQSRKDDIINDDHRNIYELLSECKPNYVLILTSDTMDDELADEQALKTLLYCTHYKHLHPEADFGITCEMRTVANQQLAQDSMANDFVISRNIASLMMAQIAESRELREIFEVLLRSEGFEIYMKPVKYYFSVRPDLEIDFYSVQDAVAEKGEIFIGYKKRGTDGDTILLNPNKMNNGKRTGMIFDEEDELIVLAENMEVYSV